MVGNCAVGALKVNRNREIAAKKKEIKEMRRKIFKCAAKGIC